MKWKIGEEKKQPMPIGQEYTLPDDGKFWHCNIHKVIFGPGETIIRFNPPPEFGSVYRCPILVEVKTGWFSKGVRPCGESLTYADWNYWQKYDLQVIDRHIKNQT